MTRAVHPAALTAAAVTAILFIAVFQAATALTGGRLIYSIDDPYIHLAPAERLRDGFYGINPGEPAAPAASIHCSYDTSDSVSTGGEPLRLL